ncbi:unnamed protein product [Bursaphelenchus okinawaensis]|uniref:Uncharacterized protein n=1 Tax=Bursaphelenchus okinawaensis TaxID=465554 RepID=A0A811L5B1_9BILA|nr:unnamed protein product [Bursaphelenchus okinawaensis]CAG9117474.1 unnamed protein product [Bursaphelenchus okinawaensis]
MDLITVVGYVIIAWFGIKLYNHVWHILYPYVIGTPKNLKKLAGAKWAVITGSTDGIGKAYAFELASKGFDIVLVSRSEEKLAKVAEELKKQHQDVEVKTLTFDFSESDPKVYGEKLLKHLDEIEIGIFVNNVGQMFDYPDKLHEVPGGIPKLSSMLHINATSLTILSAYVLKQMHQRKAGILVNVSSSASVWPLTYWNVYSATKKYVVWLTETLRREYCDSNITIQTLIPFMVDTNMAANFRDAKMPKVFRPDAVSFAKSAVRTIGLVDETTGCLFHQIQKEIVAGFLPNLFLEAGCNKFAMEIRDKMLKIQ